MCSLRTSTRTLLIAAICAVLTGPMAQADTLITLSEPEAYELQAIGFELRQRAEIHVEGLGLDTRNDRGFVLNFWGREDDEDQLDVYGWILDADSREPVWVMRRQDTERESAALRSVDERLTLEPGRYEAYLFSGLAWLADAQEAERQGRGREDRDDKPWWERMFTGRGRDLGEIEEDLRDCHLTLTAQDMTRSDVPRFEVTGELPGALIRQAQVGDSEFRVSGFELDSPQRLRIRALIEGERGGDAAADYGWIVHEETREVVWEAQVRSSKRAGGGSKNRLIDVEREFPSGRYLAYYGTDDSHSFDEFNTSPPHDPLNWGLAVFPGEGFDAGAFRTFVPGPLPAPLIDLSRAGDGVNLQQPFRLHADGDLHVVALGEYSSGDFHDVGWITDDRGKTAWEMRRRNTRAAGGAEKNRVFDGLVSLTAGDYILYYTSDGSHSYEEYNAARPFEPQNWGITVRSGPGLAARSLELIEVAEMAQTGDVLAQLIGIGDDDRQRRRFMLDEDTRVEVYVLGEGRGGRMHDYGWIVDDDTGRRVWEMEYRDTDHAGGADKNRRFSGEVLLPAGNYVVVYETDGSHSFGGWNASSPRDPSNWGITLRRAP